MEKIVEKNWFLVSENSVFRSPVIPFHQCFCKYRIGTLVQPTKEKHIFQCYNTCRNDILQCILYEFFVRRCWYKQDTGKAPNVLFVRFVILDEFQNIEKKNTLLHCMDILWRYLENTICLLITRLFLRNHFPSLTELCIFLHWNEADSTFKFSWQVPPCYKQALTLHGGQSHSLVIAQQVLIILL